MSASRFPVFTRAGDATPELEQILRELGAPAEQAGLHKSLYVTRANQTVVMVTREDSPLAEALRSRKGWEEPTE